MAFWKGFGGAHTVGIDFGSHTLKLVHLRPIKSSFEILNLATLALPLGTLVEGDILDAFTLEGALKELFSKEKVKTRDVSLAISGNGVISKKVTLSEMSPEELESQLSLIAAQYIPLSEEEMTVDYQVLPSSHKEAQKMDVILVAVKQKLIENLLSVVKGADLNPVSVETVPSSLAHLFSLIHPDLKQERIALLHLGASLSQFIVLENNTASFCRDLTLGGNFITEELREKLRLSFPEAEALKISSSKEKHLPKETLEIIAQASQTLCREVEHSLNLYVNQVPEAGLDKIFLSGGTSKIPNMKDWVQTLTGVKTEILHPLTSFTYDKQKFQAQELEAIIPVALGLASQGLSP